MNKDAQAIENVQRELSMYAISLCWRDFKRVIALARTGLAASAQAKRIKRLEAVVKGLKRKPATSKRNKTTREVQEAMRCA